MATTYHENGKIKWSDSGTAYHDNGKIAYSSSGTFYDSNGKIVKKSSFSISLGKGITLNIIPNIKITVYGRKIN